MQNISLVVKIIFAFVFPVSLMAQSNNYGYLKNDTLYIGNKQMERVFKWNNGNLITVRLEDKKNHHTWICEGNTPDFNVPAPSKSISGGRVEQKQIEANGIHSSYLQITVYFSIDKLDVQRVFRIYDDTPAIGCDLYLKGTGSGNWGGLDTDKSGLKNIESLADAFRQQAIPILDNISLPGRHWQLEVVRFTDITDQNNTLINVDKYLSYRENFIQGNILFAHNQVEEKGIFFMKEAPCSNVQLAYPGADFITNFGHIKVAGLGLLKEDLSMDTWVRGYSSVLGVYAGGDIERLTALRQYQKQLRILAPQRDETVMLNNWGDRSRDAKMGEAFCLKEVECAAKLGLSHYQLDDGWQEGRGGASVFAGGSFKNIWGNPNYWKPHKDQFPNGLKPIVDLAKQKGIEMCLWFNPSEDNDYENWEKDADALIGYYKEFGIRIFKVDGVTLANKLSEVRFRAMCDKILKETDNQASLNVDVTASKRTGYVYFSEYGNLFLENRYTDWQNYYPYWTLRNLWMLSKYTPVERLQAEFLNKWRNQKLYGDDILAPATYSFDYLFAITMAGQPIAWMEAYNLPEEAYSTKKLIETYRKIQYDFHSGIIFPIGDEPSGKSWTGFQSIIGDRGYILLYREKNIESKRKIKLWIANNKNLEVSMIWGNDKQPVLIKANDKGEVEFNISKQDDFILLTYKIKK